MCDPPDLRHKSHWRDSQQLSSSGRRHLLATRPVQEMLGNDLDLWVCIATSARQLFGVGEHRRQRRLKRSSPRALCLVIARPDRQINCPHIKPASPWRNLPGELRSDCCCCIRRRCRRNQGGAAFGERLLQRPVGAPTTGPLRLRSGKDVNAWQHNRRCRRCCRWSRPNRRARNNNVPPAHR